VEQHLLPLDAMADESFEHWIEKTHYTRRKKEQLRRLFMETCAQIDDQVSDYVVKCFIKDEAYPMYKFPRGIYARCDDFKIRIGPLLKLIEEEVFDLPYFIKKVPVPDRPRVLLERFGFVQAHDDRPDEILPRLLVNDYTAYESVFVPMMMLVEMIMYSWMVQNMAGGREFMRNIEKLRGWNICKFKFIIAYILALRMSGENTTSIGNGFNNMMVTFFNIESIGGKVIAALFEGDDCLVYYIGPMVRNQQYLDLGFLAKPQFFVNFNEASFCGQIFDLDTLTVIADPIKYIMNIGWVSVRYANAKDKVLRGLLRSRALSLLYQYPGCPIIQNMALAYIRLTEGVKPVYEKLDEYHQQIQREALKAKLPIREIKPSTRELMEKVFKVRYFDQLIIERYFDSLETISIIPLSILGDYVNADQLEFGQYFIRKGYVDDFIPELNNV
jgi:hypothetical protein